MKKYASVGTFKVESTCHCPFHSLPPIFSQIRAHKKVWSAHPRDALSPVVSVRGREKAKVNDIWKGRTHTFLSEGRRIFLLRNDSILEVQEPNAFLSRSITKHIDNGKVLYVLPHCCILCKPTRRCGMAQKLSCVLDMAGESSTHTFSGLIRCRLCAASHDDKDMPRVLGVKALFASLFLPKKEHAKVCIYRRANSLANKF